jgi:hypothetical protein
MTYTTTREYNHKNAQELWFSSVEYDLHYSDQRELAERLFDSLEYAVRYDSTERPSDMIHQITDEWLTTWTGDLAEMWIRNNCPQPDIQGHTSSTIISQMNESLYALGSEYLYGLVGVDDTIENALERVSKIWPVGFTTAD